MRKEVKQAVADTQILRIPYPRLVWMETSRSSNVTLELKSQVLERLVDGYVRSTSVREQPLSNRQYVSQPVKSTVMIDYTLNDLNRLASINRSQRNGRSGIPRY